MLQPYKLRNLLGQNKCLILPAAHDALTSRLIEEAGFSAYQVGGFSHVGTQYALPDLDFHHLGDRWLAVKNIVEGSNLPVIVDCDDGYGDVKNITYLVKQYERLNVAGLFIEDQLAPKRCGQMANKKLIPTEMMVGKIKAAVDARQNDTYIIARTDSIEVEGIDEALDRGHDYLYAGADAIYVEGPENHEQLKRIGEHFKYNTLATTMMEGGGKTPWHSPQELTDLNYNLIFYPTTLLFSLVTAIRKSLDDLKQNRKMESGVTLEEFEKIVKMNQWEQIEKKFPEGTN